MIEHDGGHLGIILGECFQTLKNRHLGTQAQVRLGQFHADRSTSDDDQVADGLLIFEDGLVGEIGN